MLECYIQSPVIVHQWRVVFILLFVHISDVWIIRL